MIGVVDAFSASYREARVKFLEAAAIAGLRIASHKHPLLGVEGETLALDTALDWPERKGRAQRLLIVSSACHGIEGYCGSGVQVFALHDAQWRAAAHEAGVAVLYLHALNPHGFSFGRRVTHENVDLNRNFQDFSRPLPANPEYAALHPLLLSAHWPPDAENQAAIDGWIATHGLGAFQAAVSRGQYQFPDGLFFGGTAPTWSNRTLRGVLRESGAGMARIAWVDLHTGLGPRGVGERIFACRDDAAALARARAWWGSSVTSIYDGSSTSALLTGLMWGSVYEECPQAEFTGIALEYGTEPLPEMMMALRGDHWLHLHPEANPDLARNIRARIRAAFYTETDSWKGQIISQARQALLEAVRGLAS